MGMAAGKQLPNRPPADYQLFKMEIKAVNRSQPATCPQLDS